MFEVVIFLSILEVFEGSKLVDLNNGGGATCRALLEQKLTIPIVYP